MKPSYRCWAEIDLTALQQNLAWLRNRVGHNRKILTVVKADAYGHGLKAIARLLMQSGTDLFGVANLTEAECIASVGRGWPVLVLGACLPDETERAVALGVRPTISSVAEVRAFSTAAERVGSTVRVHVKVDTGMGRLGVSASCARDLVQAIQDSPRLDLEGLYTHFASAEDDPEYSRRQRAEFARVLEQLHGIGVKPSLVHASNSAGVLWEPEGWLNLVRPGLLVYGVRPPGRREAVDWPGEIRPALSWFSRVSLVKEVPAGTALSYGGTFVASKRMRIAILTNGYGDGYLRSGSNRAMVLIRGRRCQSVGRITMDQMLVDVSEVEGVAPGDVAVLIGRQGSAEIAVNELAEWCGTVPWEILTNITYRVPRMYRGSQAA